MSKIVDDLLQEVEQLEESTQQLNDNVQKVETQNSQLKSGETNSLDADLVALETAKTAQEASLQSHLAAKAAIKMAEQLKSQSLELEELNYTWRQSIRTTSKEMKSAKTTFIALMAGSVAANIIALSVIGYFFYESNKQNSQFKGQILDIIQIESNLLSKKITLKVDELSSLTEALSGDIIRMKSTLNQSVKSQSSLNDNVAKTPGETAIKARTTDTKVEQKTEAESDIQNATSEINPSTATIDYSELKALVEKILAEQHKLQEITLAESRVGTLDASQVKKLNDISWLVRKQEKALKAIQANLTNGGATRPAVPSSINDTLNELKVQLRLLTEQQLTIQNQVENLQADFKKYASEPAPYSYKAK